MGKTFNVLAGLVSDRWKEPSICEACGNSFVCGATLAGCWCSEIKLTSQDREQLRVQYGKCLCRPCLEARSNKVAANPTTP